MAHYDKLIALLKQNDFNTDAFGPTLLESVLPHYDAPAAKNLEVTFELIIENQRGVKLCGIPMFSKNSLFPHLDPPPFQRLDGLKVVLSLGKIENYPLPDLGWRWTWHKWYVLMLDDVDDLGWVYLLIFLRMWLKWHGTYYFGDFVRRRVWVRMRQRVEDEE